MVLLTIFAVTMGNSGWLLEHDSIVNALKGRSYDGMMASLVCAAFGPDEVNIGIQYLSTSTPYALFITPFDVQGSTLCRNVILISEITKIKIFDKPFETIRKR